MGHIHVFDGAVDGRWARMLVGREIWYGARGLKKVSFLMESAGRAAVSLSGRDNHPERARARPRAAAAAGAALRDSRRAVSAG